MKINKKILDTSSNSLDVPLTEEQREEIASIVVNEIENIDNDRQEEKENWQLLRDAYATKPDDAKDFPWENSSNIYLPIIAAHTRGVCNRLIRGFFGNRPLWLAESYDANSVDITKERERNVDYVARNEVKLQQTAKMPVFDACLLGLGAGRLIFKNELKRRYVEQSVPEDQKEFKQFIDGYKENESKQNITLKNKKGKVFTEEVYIEKKIVFEYIRREDFYFPKNVSDLNEARFCGHKFTLRWNDIKQYELLSNWIDISKIEEGYEDDKEGLWKQEFEFVEGILRYDVDDDGYEEMIVVTVCLSPQVLTRAVYFPFEHGECYYIPFKIEDRDDSFDGRGIGEKDLEINLAANMTFNQSVDSSTLRNLPWGLARNGSHFDPDKDRLSPGAFLWTDDPGRDIMFPYIPGNEREPLSIISLLQRFGEMNTGYSQGMSGKDSPTDPNAPASKTMALLSEAMINIEEYSDNLAKSWQTIARQIDSLCKQFHKDRKFQYMTRDGIKSVAITPEFFKDKIDFYPQKSVLAVNKALERQEIRDLYEFLRQEPLLQQDPTKVLYLVDLLIRSYGVEWEKHAWNLLPSKEELQQKRPEEVGNVMQSFIQSLKQQGATDEQVAQAVALKMKELSGKQPEIMPTTLPQQVNLPRNRMMRPTTNRRITPTNMKRNYRMQQAKAGL